MRGDVGIAPYEHCFYSFLTRSSRRERKVPSVSFFIVQPIRRAGPGGSLRSVSAFVVLHKGPGGAVLGLKEMEW